MRTSAYLYYCRISKATTPTKKKEHKGTLIVGVNISGSGCFDFIFCIILKGQENILVITANETFLTYRINTIHLY